jgi:hypothetical protein
MSIIEAAAMRLRTMADGSLRIECEVEPRHAQAAFALFGAPGTPMALAALRVAGSDTSPEPVAETPEPRQDKPIAKWLALRCKEPAFRAWLAPLPQGPLSEDEARDLVCAVCRVTSRGLIDGNPEAEELFRSQIYGPWGKHHQAVNA